MSVETRFFTINEHRFRQEVENDVTDFFKQETPFALRAPRWLFAERTDRENLARDLLCPATQFAEGRVSTVARLGFDLLTLVFRIVTLVPRVLYNACADQQTLAFVRFIRARGIETRTFTELKMATVANNTVTLTDRLSGAKEDKTLRGKDGIYAHLFNLIDPEASEANFGEVVFNSLDDTRATDAQRMQAIENAKGIV